MLLWQPQAAAYHMNILMHCLKKDGLGATDGGNLWTDQKEAIWPMASKFFTFQKCFPCMLNKPHMHLHVFNALQSLRRMRDHLFNEDLGPFDGSDVEWIFWFDAGGISIFQAYYSEHLLAVHWWAISPAGHFTFLLFGDGALMTSLAETILLFGCWDAMMSSHDIVILDTSPGCFHKQITFRAKREKVMRFDLVWTSLRFLLAWDRTWRTWWFESKRERASTNTSILT